MIHTFVHSPKAVDFVSRAEPRTRGSCVASLMCCDTLGSRPIVHVLHHLSVP